jgi:hypothetical protein
VWISVVAQLTPGLAFSLVCDAGFAVGVVTSDVPKIGSLIWIAEPTFDKEPTIEQVDEILAWRWPVFFPLAAALRRNLVNLIGQIAVPVELKSFPLLRSRNGQGGWTLVEFIDGSSQPAGPAADPSIPRYKVVNDTKLREMIDSGWRPEREW